ncbi:ABC transporter ATP-binding protein [Vibrio salinus]|uniref:ABC transporter ATP-binding protein n=1 Tax=Vibrio salinus TaxID=2899784 RepID=UPI001E62B705|nr:ABC transporter ATP-binding protein [Vibrio salinus]MCE0495030.1 ABC transporter ATP-binding protein/permease [Vibrio salinus]
MFKQFEKLTQAFPNIEPNQPPSSLWAFCLYYTKGFIRPLIYIGLLSTIIAIVEVGLFGFMGKLVDWLSNSNPATFFADNQWTLISLSILILIIMPAIIGIHSLLVHQTMLGNYPMSIRWLAHRYLLKQSLSFYQDEFAGRIATKVMQTSLAIRETVMKLVDVFVFVSVYFVSILFILGDSDWRLMLPMVAWLVAYIGIQLYYVPKLKDISSLQAHARSTMTGRFVDSYTNIQTVKLFSHHQRETSYVKKSMEGFLTTVHSQMRLVTGFNIWVEIANYMLLFSIAAISIYLWSYSAISIGAIAIAISLALRINGMSKWIMWEIGGLFENMGTVVDGMNSLSQPIQIQDQSDSSELTVKLGSITFDDVSFDYGEHISVINHLSLTIKPGEKVGVVGRSGAGKSTLVNLLLRFHEIKEGKICIDGQPIDQVTQESLRKVIGVVTQDTSLLHRSIKENILYGNPDASDEELYTATRQAHADEFISTLTDPYGNKGYDAQVGERGVKLSGGQRQRIAISRVLLKNAPILILDEATSALDSEVEAAIQESLYQLMEGKTVIAIAHRLSTIAEMDRLIVLDEGKIVEEGTHQELIDKNGIYAHLWAHQTGGYIATN